MKQELVLINADDERWIIDKTSSLRAFDVSGLGFNSETNYIGDYGNQRVINESVTNQDFEANFRFGDIDKGNAYEVFNRFVVFLSKKPLRLENTTGKNTLTCYVNLTSLSKTALEEGRLTESFVCRRISNWYRIKSYTQHQISSGVAASGFMVPFVFPTDVVFGTLTSDKKAAFSIKNNSVYLSNQSDRMSPVKITITGACSNPYWEVFQDSHLVCSDGYDVDIASGFSLEVSSLFQERTVFLVDYTGKKSSIFQQQQMARGGFVHIPAGQSVIVFHCGNASVSFDLYEEVDLF